MLSHRHLKQSQNKCTTGRVVLPSVQATVKMFLENICVASSIKDWMGYRRCFLLLISNL